MAVPGSSPATRKTHPARAPSTSAIQAASHAGVNDWLDVLASCQPAHERGSAAGAARRTLALAVLRGALLDLLATGDEERVTAAVRHELTLLQH